MDNECAEYAYDFIAFQLGLPDFEQYKETCKKKCTQYKKECNPKRDGDINRVTCPLVYAGLVPNKKPKVTS